jgi:hypothetical protein
MAKTKEESAVLFTVHGCTIYKDHTYTLVDKPDSDAPDGFRRLGVTKLPSEGVGETFHCRWISSGIGNEGVWDTGFYTFSPCYSGMEETRVKTIIAALKKNVVDPFEKSAGKVSVLSQDNDEFWAKKRFYVESDKVYNMSNPKDVLDLYMGLMTFQITPQGQEGDSKYRDSSYVLVDTTKRKKIKEEKSVEKFEAVGIFYELLQQEPDKLIAVMQYLGINVNPLADKVTLMHMFDQYLEGDTSKIRMFKNTVEDCNTDEGFTKILLYRKLREENNKPKSKLTRTPKGVYFFEDQELGGDLKSAAERVSREESLYAVKQELLKHLDD